MKAYSTVINYLLYPLLDHFTSILSGWGVGFSPPYTVLKQKSSEVHHVFVEVHLARYGHMAIVAAAGTTGVPG